MKTALVSLGLLVLLGGCSAAPAPAGTSPTPTDPTISPASTTPATTPTAPTTVATPTPSATKDPPKEPVSFAEPQVYSDGVRIEVVKVKLTKLSEEGGLDTELAVGVPIQIVSVRVTNGSGARISLDDSDAVLTYGPDKREATGVDDVGTDTLYGKLKAGAAKTGRYGFAAPEKQLDAVTLSFTLDSAHPRARFQGSLR